MASRLDFANYSVAWIAVLAIEAEAALCTFDQRHDGYFESERGDDYVYIGGELNGHNIVLATLPDGQNYGVGAAAALVSHIKARFPNIWFALLVGVAAGLPNLSLEKADRYRDIRLGDVLVCLPDKANTGIVHYDLGQDTENGFLVNSRQAETPAIVRAAIRHIRLLQKRPFKKGNLFARYLQQLQDADDERQFLRPNSDTDQFLAGSSDPVEEDDGMMLRTPRDDDETTRVWYGNIGSGNSLLRNAQRRDQLRDRYNLIGLEMEAAGVMNSLPTGVIRGVCDYGDRHKEKTWQPYAAAVAAVYAKGILCTINPSKFSAKIASVAPKLEAKVRQVELLAVNQDILASLAFPQMRERRIDVQQPHRNTCKWILDRPEYQQWQAQSDGLFWIKGKPGAGKSTLMSFLYNIISDDSGHKHGVLLEFFFSARGTELQHTFLGMLRSLMNQLYYQDSSSRAVVNKYYQTKCAAFGQQQNIWEWRLEELKSLFQRAIEAVSQTQKVLIFVDALDEAGESAAYSIAEYFHSINDEVGASSATVKICISSRHYPVASISTSLEVSVEKHNSHDIKTFIKDRLRIVAPKAEDSVATSQFLELEQELYQQADGVFQWIHLVVPTVVKSLRDGLSIREVRLLVQKVPQAIGDMYEHILRNVVSSQYLSRAFLLFQWVCLAEEPLSLHVLRYAMASTNAVPSLRGSRKVRCMETSGFVETDQAMGSQVKALSGGLLEVGANNTVQVVHQTVKEFLLSQGLAMLAFLQSSSDGDPGVQSPSWKQQYNNEITMCECQARLYWACLKYIATEIPAEKGDTRFTAFIEVSAFGSYAIKHMFIHAQKAKMHRGDDSALQVELLQQIWSFWQKIYQAEYSSSSKCPREGSTLLHVAAGENLTDIVAQLCPNATNVKRYDDRLYTPLHYAARWGHLDVLKLLAEAGGDLNAKTTDSQTPLALAAANGHPMVIQWLLQNGADLEHTTEYKGNALQAACSKGRENIVFMLLEAGADINAHTGHSGTALQTAAAQNHENIVMMLIDRGAHVNTVSGFFGTALQFASWRGREHIVQLLIDHGADVNLVGGEYGTALQAASRMGTLRIVKILLQHGAKVNVEPRGHYGTALSAAAARGQEDIVKTLLEHGADVNALGGEYGTALYGASALGFLGVVRILIEAGADINLAGTRGTALQGAVYAEKQSVVTYLQEQGATL